TGTLPVEHLLELREAGVNELKASIGLQKLGRRRVHVKRKHAALPDPRDDRASVPAGAERRVDVCAADANGQSGHRFFQQDRNMRVNGGRAPLGGGARRLGSSGATAAARGSTPRLGLALRPTRLRARSRLWRAGRAESAAAPACRTKPRAYVRKGPGQSAGTPR